LLVALAFSFWQFISPKEIKIGIGPFAVEDAKLLQEKYEKELVVL
jgi:hypothetical protein